MLKLFVGQTDEAIFIVDDERKIPSGTVVTFFVAKIPPRYPIPNKSLVIDVDGFIDTVIQKGESDTRRKTKR